MMMIFKFTNLENMLSFVTLPNDQPSVHRPHLKTPSINKQPTAVVDFFKLSAEEEEESLKWESRKWNSPLYLLASRAAVTFKDTEKERLDFFRSILKEHVCIVGDLCPRCKKLNQPS